MAVTAYYNEFDPYAAQWLRNLIAEGLIADGHVDERSIAEVSADDLAGYRQCHFFAGIGGWSLALRLAGWDDDRPVWTGSCPCQPFSAAGKQRGTDDERHLWPEFCRLIAKCRPPVVFGEQVASKAGRDWLAAVRTDLEGMGYGVGAADLCAAGVGAPHIRQRLWFVGMADADDAGLEGRREPGRERGVERPAWARGLDGGLADTDRGQRQGFAVGGGNVDNREDAGRSEGGGGAPACSENDGLADTDGERREGQRVLLRGEARGRLEAEVLETAGGCGDSGSDAIHGGWDVADWLYCRDGKWRPVEPGSFPLAHGIPGRVGLLRGYGNAIVPAVAAQFIGAVMECQP